MKIAQENPDVLKLPEPAVMLDAFAASSLNFTLYAFIGNINKTGAVRTELAMSILDAFNEAGIVIPSGPTDVALRKMDWLHDIVAEVAARPGERQAANGGPDSISHLP